MLGRGRFAKVVACSRDNEVAEKIVDIDDQRPPHDWRAEIAALERLQTSPLVIRMLDWSADLHSVDPQVHIEMPRYSYTLEHVIYHFAKAKYPPGSGWRNVMPADRVRSIVCSIAAGLAAVHSNGVIHRDLKPENIMFSEPDGDLVLIDFGIAWVSGVSDKKEPAGDRITDVSSAEYKAPELLFGVRQYTEKIDLWSLGCILAQLMSQDCASLFSPYSSDMALIAAQVRTLGHPTIAECPSLKGSVAEQLQGTASTAAGAAKTTSSIESPNRALLAKLGRLEHDPLLTELAINLLQYEWTARPTAKEVALQLE